MENKKVYTILTIHIVSLILLLISRIVFPLIGLSAQISLYLRLGLMAVLILSVISMLRVLINEKEYNSSAWFLLAIYIISSGFLISIAISNKITATGNILLWLLCVLDLLLILVGPLNTPQSSKEDEIEAIVIKEPKRMQYMETEDDLKGLKKEDSDRVIIEELKEIDVDEEVKEEREWEKKEKQMQQRELNLSVRKNRKKKSKKGRNK